MYIMLQSMSLRRVVVRKRRRCGAAVMWAAVRAVCQTARCGVQAFSWANVASGSHVCGALYDASKAGMEKVDKDHVQRVIRDSLKDTPFYRNEQRRDKERAERNSVLQRQARSFYQLPPAELRRLRRRVAQHEAMLEATRDLSRRFVHVDMDMYYAAVEEEKNPELGSRAFAVGTDAMLFTSNYIAREFGVRSGMPGFIAKKLCPQLIIVPPDFPRYEAISAIVRGIGARYDRHFVSIGLDELTMDITDYLARHPTLTAGEVCARFRREVYRRTRLTCSGGIAPTSALAKIASNVDKPNGQHELVFRTKDEVLHYVHRLTIRQVPGIGHSQEVMLNALGIRTCRDLVRRRLLLCYLFKEKTFLFYYSIGLGLVRTQVDRARAESFSGVNSRKSVNKERTFPHQMTSVKELLEMMAYLTAETHAVLLQEHAKTQCVTCVIKHCSFERRTISKTLMTPTNDYKVLYSTVKQLMQPVLHEYAYLRLAGVGYSRLRFAPAIGATAAARAGGGVVVGLTTPGTHRLAPRTSLLTLQRHRMAPRPQKTTTVYIV